MKPAVYYRLKKRADALIHNRPEGRLSENTSNTFAVVKYAHLWYGLTARLKYLRKVWVRGAGERGVTAIWYLLISPERHSSQGKCRRGDKGFPQWTLSTVMERQHSVT